MTLGPFGAVSWPNSSLSQIVWLLVVQLAIASDSVHLQTGGTVTIQCSSVTICNPPRLKVERALIRVEECGNCNDNIDQYAQSTLEVVRLSIAEEVVHDKDSQNEENGLKSREIKILP